MRALAFTVSFLLAFLLFAVQPMATRMVLPSLGGTPAVWNTVMFTFQFLLLAGYIYAHLLTTYCRPRAQFFVHGCVVLLSFTCLPLWVQLVANDTLVNYPIPSLVFGFLLQLGLPFFCLAATAPLLQSWVSRSAHPLSRQPYILYSASNLGSFAGLLGYVGVVEPLLDLPSQSGHWSLVYVVGMALLIGTGLKLRPARALVQTATGKVSWSNRATWIFLAFLPSSLSLGITTHITTDIASIPVLWVIPLSIYLLSFVDAFRDRPVLVPVCQRLGPIIGLFAIILYGLGGSVTLLFPAQLLAFAMLAFAVHGWLAARKPASHSLTQFYVCLSLGGALGGVANGLLAPMLLRSTLEYPVILLLTSLTAFLLLQRHDAPANSLRHYLRMGLKTALTMAVLTTLIYLVTAGTEPMNSVKLVRAAAFAAIASMLIFRSYIHTIFTCASVSATMIFAISIGIVGNATLFKDRNFFGALRVYEDPKENARYIVHDTTSHGSQSLDPAKRTQALSYYYPIVQIVRALHADSKPIAVAGLGAGTLNCVAAKGQKVDFFEINPMVKHVAENPDYFTYLRDCPGDATVILGDGRIRIAEQPDQKYGLIILDAFSSDAIPSHLLTQEALNSYFDKLTPDGILIFNITNRHINLAPLLAAEAKELNATAYQKFFEAPASEPLLNSCYWVVMAKNPARLKSLVSGRGWEKLKDEGNRPWTDQYINLLPYFKVLRDE